MKIRTDVLYNIVCRAISAVRYVPQCIIPVQKLIQDSIYVKESNMLGFLLSKNSVCNDLLWNNTVP